MQKHHSKILVLALGNEILHDDAVGILAARQLRNFSEQYFAMQEFCGGGFDLVEILNAYDFVLILDSIFTGKHPAGTILELSKNDFQEMFSLSPHHLGIPEAMQMIDVLQLPFPKHFCALAMEVENPYDIGEGLSDAVKNALPQFVKRAEQLLRRWKKHSVK
jgi:hydrogenase maturation protease